MKSSKSSGEKLMAGFRQSFLNPSRSYTSDVKFEHPELNANLSIIHPECKSLSAIHRFYVTSVHHLCVVQDLGLVNVQDLQYCRQEIWISFRRSTGFHQNEDSKLRTMLRNVCGQQYQQFDSSVSVECTSAWDI